MTDRRSTTSQTKQKMRYYNRPSKGKRKREMRMCRHDVSRPMKERREFQKEHFPGSMTQERRN